MVEGETLKGKMVLQAGEDRKPKYPGTLTLSGKMILTVQPDGAPNPTNLLTQEHRS